MEYSLVPKVKSIIQDKRKLFYLFSIITLAVPIIIPVFFDPYWIKLYSEILIWSLLAASVNILFGYLGLLSFGQALFFGFGMYGVAIAITKFGFGLWGSFAFGIFASTLMALISGSLAVRLTWHYFAIITVIFSLIFYFVALTWKPITGGDDGLPFSPPNILDLGNFKISLTNSTHQYYFIIFFVLLCYYFILKLLESPLGKAFIAVKENNLKSELIGLDTYKIKLLGFVFAGLIAGVSGCLLAFYGRYASASYMFYHVSGEAVVWTIIGGVGSFLGPIFGTGLLIVLREELSHTWDHYLLIVGALVILIVIFFPNGISGLLKKMLKN
jgi:branched-chain amino acid transport system permease protein|tara:strand:+ start:3383 stop:4366 length:984 start_codon:yes stop_codon:yes gene_type:complete